LKIIGFKPVDCQKRCAQVFEDGEKCVLYNIELPKMFSAVSFTSDFVYFLR